MPQKPLGTVSPFLTQVVSVGYLVIVNSGGGEVSWLKEQPGPFLGLQNEESQGARLLRQEAQT